MNKLHDVVDEKKRKVYSAQQARLIETTPVPVITTPSVVSTESIKAPIALAEIGTLPMIGKLTSEERKQMIMGNPRDWGVIFPKITDLSVIPKISKEVA